MTRPKSEQPDDRDVPSELVLELNELGFALVSSSRVHTFARTTIGNELELTLEPRGSSAWRVGLKWRPSAEVGRAPYALVPVSLGRLGESEDGVTLDLSTTFLVDTLPRLLTESILPLADLTPG